MKCQHCSFWTELDRLSLSGLLAKLQVEKEFAGQLPPAESSAGEGCSLEMETSAKWGGGAAPAFGPNRWQTPDV